MERVRKGALFLRCVDKETFVRIEWRKRGLALCWGYTQAVRTQTVMSSLTTEFPPDVTSVISVSITLFLNLIVSHRAYQSLLESQLKVSLNFISVAWLPMAFSLGWMTVITLQNLSKASAWFLVFRKWWDVYNTSLNIWLKVSSNYKGWLLFKLQF